MDALSPFFYSLINQFKILKLAPMKDIILAILVTALVLLILKTITEKPEKVIDLPEEIQLAKPGDTLKVYKVTTDSIYIQFYNHRNR